MKKIILLCCFTLFSVSCLLSQNTETDEKKSFQLPKNEFHISWGDPLCGYPKSSISQKTQKKHRERKVFDIDYQLFAFSA